MKTFFATLAFVALLSWGTVCQADITGVDCYNDGDGAIEMNYWDNTFNDPKDVNVFLDETLKWAPAHAIVDITCSDDLDPTARFTKEVDNESVSAWTGYIINVVKSTSFSITSATEPSGWDTPIISTPVLQSSGIYAGSYLGTVTYSAGLTGGAIPILGTGVFKFTTTFAGVSNIFTLEQIPTYGGVAIPEPGTLALVLLGGLCGVAIFKRRQHAR